MWGGVRCKHQDTAASADGGGYRKGLLAKKRTDFRSVCVVDGGDDSAGPLAGCVLAHFVRAGAVCDRKLRAVWWTGI